MPVSAKQWNNLSTSQRLALLKLAAQKPKRRIRMNPIKRLNYFFFLDSPDDKMHPHDAWMFYGVLGGSLVITAVLWVVTKF